MKFKLKTLLASFLVTAALVTPAVVMSTSTMTPAEVLRAKAEADALSTSELLSGGMSTFATAPYAGELHFSGASLEVMTDGSVQAIFDISVDKLQNCTGTEFYLTYNPDYLEPSLMTAGTVEGTAYRRNTPISTMFVEPYKATDVFFTVDDSLYGKTSGGVLVSPFSDEGVWSSVDTLTSEIYMRLQLDQRQSGDLATLGAGGEIKVLEHFGGDADTRVAYVINHEDDVAAAGGTHQISLGQISFRVVKDKLPEIVRYFGNNFGLTDPTTTPWRTVGGKDVKLIFVEPTRKVGNSGTTDDTWGMYAIKGAAYNRDGNTRYSPKVNNVEDLYYFELDGKTPVAVELANPTLTINAYQGYTYGEENATHKDVALSLQRYSPVATVTYADGSKENIVVPWGKDTGGHTYEYNARKWQTNPDGTVSPVVPPVYSDTFKPTGGHYYPRQTVEVEHKGVKYIFPVPVQADLTVTPITLLDLTASDLTRRYTVTTAADVIVAGSDLNLPGEARMVTDVVPGGVSMVMPIGGWTPTQPDGWTGADVSTWPVLGGGNGSTLMNSLKAKEYNDTDKYPYWPAAQDRNSGDVVNHPEYFIGTYEFQMADSFGGTVKTGFTRAEIEARFPWLTVPRDNYAIPNAYRYIIGEEHVPMSGSEPRSYTATYIENTFTDDNGQPTVGISVQRADGASISKNSKFRVWLPNGVELGTGMTSKDISLDAVADPSQSFTVTDWFLKIAGMTDDTITWKHALLSTTQKEYQRPKNETTGWYATMAQEMNTGGVTSFHLIFNPGDPDLPNNSAASFSTERETLRRYINLGGWFHVSVCEDVDNYYWSDPIPVYVKPRPNEYQSDKIYNFLGENYTLVKLPQWVGTTFTMPRGYYTTVDDKGLPSYTAGARDVESYGIPTLYDGMTGAQPGELFQFTVDTTAPWLPQPGGATDPAVGPKAIWFYGKNPAALPATGMEFLDGELYEAFGYVYQPDTGDHTVIIRTEDGVHKTPDDGVVNFEKITLTSAEPVGITRDPITNNVELAKYNDQTVGYQSRQEYLFTITNVGTLDIDGLSINGLFDGYPQDTPGGRFELLQPPATFLAAGESTTFIMTYVYDLPANDPTGKVNVPLYRDTLFITSDRHPVPGKHANAPASPDYLLDFDAEIAVSDYKLHRVDVVVYPQTVNDSDLDTDKNYKQPITYPMGTADIIIGEQVAAISDGLGGGGTVDDYTMDYTPATRSYAEKNKVYVVVRPKDEYTVASISCVDAAGNNILIPQYAVDSNGDPWPDTTVMPNDGRLVYVDSLGAPVLGVAVLDDGTFVYTFEMPAYDATVTVRFEEDIMSKLRLSNIVDFSAGPNMDDTVTPPVRIPNATDITDPKYGIGTPGTADQLLKPKTNPVADENTYKVWRKSFTKAENDAAKTWATSRSADKDLYLMTAGTVIPHNDDPELSGDVFDPSCHHYLVVVPYEADRSQIEVTLRKVLVHIDGVVDTTSTGEQTPDDKRHINDDIQPYVTMARYDKDFMDYNGYVDSVSSPYREEIYPATQGNTATPTIHTSLVFDSPEPGESCFIRIRIGSQAPGATGTTFYQYYYVELRRRAENPEVVLHYGNSPYGMIMNNATKFDTALKQDTAKEAFRAGYTFRGLDASSVPAAALTAGLDKATYWREAWVKNGQLYEPESGLGMNWVYNWDTTVTPNVFLGNSWVDRPEVYDVKENLDLNDYSYFAILGEDIREPGIISAKDSSGRPVDLDKIAAAAQVVLLDTTKDKQADRFSGQTEAWLDLGVAGRRLTTIAGQGVASADLTGDNWPVASGTATDSDGNEIIVYTEIEHIRPGRYEMVYTFTDYDGIGQLSVTRPFVILTPVGDVNADLVRDKGVIAKTPPATGFESTDEYVMENRVVDPMGYTVLTTKQVPVIDPATGVQAIDPITSAPIFEDVFLYNWNNIFKYRVCDVNNDRNINNIDANQIRKNVTANDGWLRFYHPTDYGLGT